MKASKNAHDWHCEDHDTYGWRGEACPLCPKARGEAEMIEQLEARLSNMTQAVGLATTLKPDMVIDVENPIGMMEEVVEYVGKENKRLTKQSERRLIGLCKCGLKRDELLAENKRLREALEARRDWFAMQIKSASNGNLSEWDRHTLQIELDATNAALTTTKGS